MTEENESITIEIDVPEETTMTVNELFVMKLLEQAGKLFQENETVESSDQMEFAQAIRRAQDKVLIASTVRENDHLGDE